MSTGLRAWFELDLPAFLMSPEGARLVPVWQQGVPACMQDAHAAWREGELEHATASALAAMNGIWEEGRAFERFAQFEQLAEQLILSQGLAALPRAALSVASLIARLLGNVDMKRLRTQVKQVERHVEQAHSDALRTLLSAVHIHLLIMLGELHHAETLLDDARHLVPQSSMSLLPKLELSMSMTLLDAVKGRAGKGLPMLDALMTEPAYAGVPPAMALLAETHLLQNLAWQSESARTDAMAEALRSKIIPGNKAYHRSYVHFALAVTELIRCQPARALSHATLAMELGELCGSKAAALVPALVIGQALADLGREDEATRHFRLMLPQWAESGYQLITAAAWLELCHIHDRRNRARQAREALAQAVAALPPHETLPDYHRRQGFAQALKERHAPVTDTPPRVSATSPRVWIRTFGVLRVDIEGQTLYDRDWKGSRTKTLLKALIVLGGHKVSAQRLGDLLWPDADGDQARQNLKVALWRLHQVGRNHKGTDHELRWLATQHGHVSIIKDWCEVDALSFLDTDADATPERIQAALDLYTDDFLTTDDSEPWIADFREQLKAHYIRLSLALADKRHTNDVLPYLEQALVKSNCNEQIYERLINLHLQAGREAQALAVFEEARSALLKVLGRAPGSSLQALQKSIRLST